MSGHPPGVGDDHQHFDMPSVGCVCVGSIPDMNCPVHGDVVSKVDGQETSEELERVLKNTQEELMSTPPPDMEVAACAAHGSPFVQVLMREDGPHLKIYEDGCTEPL